MLVRRFQKRNASVVVEATGEVLFAPGTELSIWKNRFSQRIREATTAAAPMHDYAKRPLRPHPGPHLKETITASTTTRITRGGGRFYVAVGSRSRYSTFVDQGTAAHMAKLLPPWAPGSPSLYEASWRVPDAGQSPWLPQGDIPVRGQRARNFFDKGLAAGFASMRMRSFQVPGEGVSGLRSAITGEPSNLIDLGMASFVQGYDPSLAAWRAWRDAAFRHGDVLGGHQSRATREHTRRALKRGHKTLANLQKRDDAKAHTRAKNARRKQESRDRKKDALIKKSQTQTATLASLKKTRRAEIENTFKARGLKVTGLVLHDNHTITFWLVNTRGVKVFRSGTW